MNIVVCIKQVPDNDSVKIDPVTNSIVREGSDAILNPLDLYAIEEAVRLKERYSGVVYVITMGPPQAEKVLREAISYGADEAILLTDRAFSGADTLATSYTLSEYIKTLKPDIILTGKQAIDGDTGQVGPGIAEHLGITHITEVCKIELIDINTIVLERLIERGRVRVKTSLPILLGVLKDINIPRVPGLKGRINGKKSIIKKIDSSAIYFDKSRVGFEGSPTRVSDIFSPKRDKNSGKFFDDEPHIAVNRLLNELKLGGLNLSVKKLGVEVYE